MKGYVDLANTIQSAQLTSANIGIIGYVDNAVSTANIGIKGYVDSVANQSIYGNANVTAYTVTMGFTNFSNVNVAAYVTTNGLTNYSNVNTKAYTESMGYQNFGNVNVAAYVTTANSAVVGYVDNAISTANVGMNGFVNAVIDAVNVANIVVTQSIVSANLGMKGYVDSVASQSIYGNSNVKSYLTGGFDGNIIPSANAVYSLGSITNQWKELFVSNSTIYIGGVPISTDSQGNVNIDSITVPDLWAGNIYLGSVGYMSGLIFDNGTTVDGGTAQLGNIFVGSRDANLKLRSNVRIGTGTECWSVTTLVPGLSQDDHPSLIVLSNTKSISSTTGAVVIGGGLGVAGNINIGGNLTVSNIYVPTANNSVGTAGQIAWDGDYVYICIATNTWKRANISTW
jgi:hypothetical protein